MEGDGVFFRSQPIRYHRSLSGIPAHGGDVSFEKKGRESCLKLKITNHGFACCGEAVRFDLSAGGQSGERRISSLDCGLGKLEGGESLTLRIPLEPEQCTKGTCFYGELRRVRDESLIRFANEPAGERLLLGGIN